MRAITCTAHSCVALTAFFLAPPALPPYQGRTPRHRAAQLPAACAAAASAACGCACGQVGQRAWHAGSSESRPWPSCEAKFLSAGQEGALIGTQAVLPRKPTLPRTYAGPVHKPGAARPHQRLMRREHSPMLAARLSTASGIPEKNRPKSKACWGGGGGEEDKHRSGC